MKLREDIKAAQEKASDASYDLNQKQRDGEAIDELEAEIKDIRLHIRDLEMHDAWASAEIAELTVAVDMIIDAVENLDKRLIDALKRE